jgi:hypothetical protein
LCNWKGDRHNSVYVDWVSVAVSESIQGNDVSEGLLITVLFILPFHISTGADRIQMVQGLNFESPMTIQNFS